MKEPLTTLLALCAPDNEFVRDAIEYAILAGNITPKGDDLMADMGGAGMHFAQWTCELEDVAEFCAHLQRLGWREATE